MATKKGVQRKKNAARLCDGLFRLYVNDVRLICICRSTSSLLDVREGRCSCLSSLSADAMGSTAVGTLQKRMHVLHIEHISHQDAGIADPDFMYM